MGVNEIGALLIGIVVGWLLAYTLRRKEFDWKDFGAVVLLIVGGSGLDYLFKSNLAGYFWIGIFIGFFIAIIVGAILGQVPSIIEVAKIAIRIPSLPRRRHSQRTITRRFIFFGMK